MEAEGYFKRGTITKAGIMVVLYPTMQRLFNQNPTTFLHGAIKNLRRIRNANKASPLIIRTAIKQSLDDL